MTTRLHHDAAATVRYAARAGERAAQLRQVAERRAKAAAESDRRIIGASDLVDVSFLACGMNAARAVCRIRVQVSDDNAPGYGTGFLVAPTLLLTNNHVLESPAAARASRADFNYEKGTELIAKSATVFRFEPDQFFYTVRELDFTLVAVAPTAEDGTSLASFGYLQLHDEQGKELLDGCVSIVQHPGGETKQVALRESRVVDVLDRFLHYSTDTERGSSGSPVFDDQWQVVALHHAGVKQRDAAGNVLTRDGQIWHPDLDEAQIAWIANEGVRVSRICAQLRAGSAAWTDAQRGLIEALLDPSQAPAPGAPLSFELAALDLEWYAACTGYDPDFLGQRVELPRLSSDRRDDVVPLADGSGHVLTYPHFSVVMSKSRRLARFTAVNIAGAQLEQLPRCGDRWYFDPRIAQEYQCGPTLYSRNDLDRGHLVRRLDPVWGLEAADAEEATFHFTNSAPQHKHLNQRTWLDLEDYILKNADTHDLKVSVFTGPVFRADDMRYRGQYQIPSEFWKVAVVAREDGALSATAYLQTQKQLLGDLEFAYGAYRTYQVPVATIEGLTGLDFGVLRDCDPLADIEGTVGRVIEGPGDLRL